MVHLFDRATEHNASVLELGFVSPILNTDRGGRGVLIAHAHESLFSTADSPEVAACTRYAAPGLSNQTARTTSGPCVFEAANAAAVRAGSRRHSSIGTKETTQAFPTIDPSCRKDRGFRYKRRTVSNALVRPFVVIMLDVLVDAVS